MCRVAHFLTGKEMEEAIEKMKKWLAPGGRIYIITLSPYHYLLHDKFLPIYLKRVKQNISWPGIIEDMHQYAPHQAGKIPKFLHVMENHSLGKALRKQGLNIVEERFFDYKRPQAKSSADKGYYGIIAEKPKQ